MLKRILILGSLPFMHLYFLNRAEHLLVFQVWTIVFLLFLLILSVY